MPFTVPTHAASKTKTTLSEHSSPSQWYIKSQFTNIFEYNRNGVTFSARFICIIHKECDIQSVFTKRRRCIRVYLQKSATSDSKTNSNGIIEWCASFLAHRIQMYDCLHWCVARTDLQQTNRDESQCAHVRHWVYSRWAENRTLSTRWLYSSDNDRTGRAKQRDEYARCEDRCSLRMNLSSYYAVWISNVASSHSYCWIIKINQSRMSAHSRWKMSQPRCTHYVAYFVI